jgi:hypothetical protein
LWNGIETILSRKQRPQRIITVDPQNGNIYAYRDINRMGREYWSTGVDIDNIIGYEYNPLIKTFENVRYADPLKNNRINTEIVNFPLD